MPTPWKDNILGFVPEVDWLSIGFNPTRQNDPIDTLFGDDRTDNLVAAWQSIAAEYQVPMMAQFHAFDTEAQTTFREPVDTRNIEKGLIKVKINQSERMRALLRSGVREDALYDYVIRDGVRLAEQVFTRSKVAKNELMATGKVTIKENNLDLTVDYGVPEDQTGYELDLSAEADISAQIQAIVDDALKRGVTLTGLLTSKQNLTKMRNNASLQKTINGSIGAGALIRRAALDAYLEDEFGIGRIIINDLTYGAEHKIGTDGRPSVITKRYFPTNAVSFFSTNPAGRMGVGLWGDPPEATGGNQSTGSNSPEHPYVYIDQWAEYDPKVLWTKASGLFMPVLYNPSSLWIATVKEQTSSRSGGESSGQSETSERQKSANK